MESRQDEVAGFIGWRIDNRVIPSFCWNIVVVSFARLELRAAHSKSLKDRRRVVRSIQGKVLARFKIRVAEVGGQGSWQSIEVGFAVVGTDNVFLEALIERVIRFVEMSTDAELIAEFRDSVFYGNDAAFSQLVLKQEEEQPGDQPSEQLEDQPRGAE